MNSLLPPNSTTQERAIEGASARMADVPAHLRKLWNPDTCPENLLAWLAWAFSVEFGTDWSEAQKRNAIKQSIVVRRHMGTVGAIRKTLNGLFSDVEVQEWFNQVPAGDPYTFRVLLEADQTGISLESIADAIPFINRAKNVRSHLNEIGVRVKTRCRPMVSATTVIGTDITLSYLPPALVCSEYAICIQEIILFNETAVCL